METIITSVSSAKLCAEIAQLGQQNQLTMRGDFEVYFAQADQIPNVLLEIGRLRELTFRQVGEGTGKALDIDEFDEYYYNLFIWDKVNKKIVGGYRMGMGEEIFQQNSIEQFYIHSLFEIDEAFFPILKKSIELGRSYIVPEYQKGYLPFFLLWQGILIVLLKNPAYQYLIGPVSISKYYSGVSQCMIVEFVKRHFFDEKNAKYFSPRTPFQPELEKTNMEKMLNSIDGEKLKDLESFLCSIEPDHIKVPVLLKQYTKLNARFLSFNIDPNFSDALDGLMMLDLKRLPQKIIQLLSEK